MKNSRIESSTNREVSIITCVMVGVVLGFFGFMPSVFIPSDDFCTKATHSQECFTAINEAKEQVKILPPITFGFGFFGSFLIQWLIPKKEQPKRTPI